MAAEVKRLEQMTLSTLDVDTLSSQGYVARWATNFDNLLADTVGRAVFAVSIILHCVKIVIQVYAKWTDVD